MTIKLPEPAIETTAFSRDSSTQPYYTRAQLVQAVHDALEEAAQKMLDFQAGWVPDGFTECADAIRKMKEQVK